MLTPIDDAVPVATTTTTTTPAPDKQICVMQSAGSGVAYTVPSGRKFVGLAGHNYAVQGSAYYIEITSDGTSANTVRYYGPLGAEPYNYRVPSHSGDITLLAGTSIKNSPSGSSCYVLGVESDA
tara:strand:- start:168 stop:539 length:372 start_codon:yes stop_codon:yes gene_type:complete